MPHSGRISDKTAAPTFHQTFSLISTDKPTWLRSDCEKAPSKFQSLVNLVQKATGRITSSIGAASPPRPFCTTSSYKAAAIQQRLLLHQPPSITIPKLGVKLIVLQGVSS